MIGVGVYIIFGKMQELRRWSNFSIQSGGVWILIVKFDKPSNGEQVSSLVSAQFQVINPNCGDKVVPRKRNKIGNS